MLSKFSCHSPVSSLFGAACALILSSGAAQIDQTFSVIDLPALRIDGKHAKAHTQGLELRGGQIYVTARRDDIIPKRALLLRTSPGRKDWDAWDITPINLHCELTSLDHPGGMQSDGDHLWIPLSESKRDGRSLIRRYSISELVPGQAPKARFEFGINDHIGALAVSAEHQIVLGANWDTATVYVWDFNGRLKRTMTAEELEARKIGIASATNDNNQRAGLTVQDWKFVGGQLFASGLFRGLGVDPESSQSQLVCYETFLEPGFQRQSIPLPKQGRTELAHEAMGIVEGLAYFLPEDLGPTNRLFRARLRSLLKKPTDDR